MQKFSQAVKKNVMGMFANFHNCIFKVQAPIMQFSTKKTYGGLKDQDRIFTNLYKDGDPFIEGALKRVCSITI
jgi:hypothetical protein